MPIPDAPLPLRKARNRALAALRASRAAERLSQAVVSQARDPDFARNGCVSVLGVAEAHRVSPAAAREAIELAVRRGQLKLFNPHGVWVAT